MSVQRYCPAVPLTVQRLDRYVPNGVSSVVTSLQCTDIALNDDNDLEALTEHMEYLGSAFVETDPATPPQAFFPPTPAGVAQTDCAIYAGSGAPNNDDGTDGDYYFRSDGGVLTLLYRRVAGVWTGVL